MSLQKILTVVAMAIALFLAVVFAADLVLGVPFNRAALLLDVGLLIACLLILWQGVETFLQLK